MDKEVYRLHAKLPVYRRQVTKSHEIIKEFLTTSKNPYIAWSTGKDSTACIGLVREHKNIVAVNHDNGVELPDNYLVLKQMDNIIVHKSESLFLDLMNEYGFESSKLRKRNFVKEFESIGGYDGVVLGLRKQESAVRKRYINKPIYQRKDGMWVCLPILYWKLDDVFAYLLQKNLPIHPLYTRESHQPFEHRRVGGFISSRNRGAEYGRFVWLREQYPELWQEISIKYPEIKKYV